MKKDMRELDFEEVFQNIKQQVMEDEGYDEDDMDDEEIEDEVNSIAKERFKERFGFEYDTPKIETPTRKTLTQEQKNIFEDLKDEIYSAEDIIDGSYSVKMFHGEFSQIDELHNKLITTMREYYQLLDQLLKKD